MRMKVGARVRVEVEGRGTVACSVIHLYSTNVGTVPLLQ